MYCLIDAFTGPPPAIHIRDATIGKEIVDGLLQVNKARQWWNHKSGFPTMYYTDHLERNLSCQIWKGTGLTASEARNLNLVKFSKYRSKTLLKVAKVIRGTTLCMRSYQNVTCLGQHTQGHVLTSCQALSPAYTKRHDDVVKHIATRS